MNTTHTPGPWHVVTTPVGGKRIVGADGYAVAACQAKYSTAKDNGTRDANAGLIAKAPLTPKLADALRELLDWMDEYDKVGPNELPASQRKRARAALAEWDALP